jgi:hypothetical protein
MSSTSCAAVTIAMQYPTAIFENTMDNGFISTGHEVWKTSMSVQDQPSRSVVADLIYLLVSSTAILSREQQSTTTIAIIYISHGNNLCSMQESSHRLGLDSSKEFVSQNFMLLLMLGNQQHLGFDFQAISLTESLSEQLRQVCSRSRLHTTLGNIHHFRRTSSMQHTIPHQNMVSIEHDFNDNNDQYWYGVGSRGSTVWLLTDLLILPLREEQLLVSFHRAGLFLLVLLLWIKCKNTFKSVRSFQNGLILKSSRGSVTGHWMDHIPPNSSEIFSHLWHCFGSSAT